MSLPDLAIRRPVFITVVFLIVVLLGALSFTLLPVDLMPDVSFPTISATTIYEGVGPQEIEELVTIPLERALSSTPSLKEIVSKSSEGSSRIVMSFEWGTDLDSASDEIRTRIDRIRDNLPEDSETPSLFKFDVSTFPIIFLGISGNMNPRDLREFAEKQIQYRFERIPGVAQAEVWGGLERQIHVIMDRSKMDTYRISPSQLITAVRRGNLNEPAGQVIEGDFELLVRTEGEYTSMEEIRNSMVTRRERIPIYVKDIAFVQDTHQEIRNLVRINGVPGTRMGIRKQSGSNTVQVSRKVQEEIEKINRDFPQVRVHALYDTSKFIERAVSNVRDAALYGSILAVFILLLFLRNLRNTLVVAISIPISVVATFGLMYFANFTLNTITFGGLALGVGVLVDNAIVVLENIFRHRQQGTSKVEAARKGTGEVSMAITAATLTTITVFLPVVFMSGMAGVLFQQLAWVVCFSLFSSLLVSLTLVPLLSSRLVRTREPDSSSWTYGLIHKTSLWFKGLDGSYSRALRWSLGHSALVITITAALFAAGFLLVPFLGFELQPDTDEGEVRIRLQLPQGTRLEVTDKVARRVEEIAREQVPELQDMLTEVGSQGGWRVANTNTTSIRLYLVPQSERQRSSQQIADALRPFMADFPGLISRIYTSGGNFVMRRIASEGERLAVDVRGHNMANAYEIAVQIRRLMESVQGVSDANLSRTPGRPEKHISIDRARVATMGLSVTDIATTVRASIGGMISGYYREAGDEYEILVRYREDDRLSSEDVLAIPIQVPSGQVVPLHSLVDSERTEGPISIDRKDQERTVTVAGNLTGTRDMGSIVRELGEKIQDLRLPPDIAVVFSGEWEDQEEAFFFLKISFVLAVILVYLVMAAQFESFRYPFLIMSSLPLAFIGVVGALFLTDTTFSIQAFIGVIMLVGIVVNNAIVLVDYILQLRNDHKLGLIESLVTGGRRRLRPILMTTLTTVLGLTPMALGLGEGGELQAPMARVLIGGLFSSTFITLFFIPTLFLTVERARLSSPEEEFLPIEEHAVGSAT